MPFSIFLQVYAALIANGYTRRVDRWVDGKFLEVREREQNVFAYHSTYLGWEPIDPIYFEDLMFAERYTIQMQVIFLANGFRKCASQDYFCKFNIARVSVRCAGKYAKFRNMFRCELEKPPSSYIYSAQTFQLLLIYDRPFKKKDGVPNNNYEVIWKTLEELSQFPNGIVLEYPSPLQNKYALRYRTLPT